jgi:O-antigen/teichoic acid export membrane protein
MIWTPFLFDHYQKKDGPELIGKVFTLYTLVILAVGLIISVLSPIVIPLISDKAYHASYKLVPLVCLAAVFYGMSCVADAGILISKKTFYKPILFGGAGVVAVSANFALIPRYGETGAAFTLSLSFFALFVLVYSVSSRFYYFKLEYRKLLLMFASAIFIYCISYVLMEGAAEHAVLRIGSVLSLALFPATIWYGGVFSSQEKAMFVDFLSRHRAKLWGGKQTREVGVLRSKTTVG